MRRSIPTVLLVTGLAGAGVIGACSSSGDSPNGKGGKDGGNGCTGVCFNTGTGGSDGGNGSSANGISITPPTLALTVNPADGAPPTQQFTVHGAEAGTVGWHSSNPAVGTVDSNGLFTPTGTAGGVTKVEATVATTTV